MKLDHSLAGASSSPEVKKLTEALVKAQKQYKPIKKSAQNTRGGYWYSTLSDIVDATLTALLDNGFPMPQFQTGFLDGYGLVMVGTLRHTSGEWVSAVAPMFLLQDSNGNIREDGQSMEVAAAYAKKVLYLQLAGGWAAGDEADADASVTQAEARKEVNAVLAQEAAEKKAAPDAFKRIEARAKAVRSMPEELAKTLAGAEAAAEAGDITPDQLARLKRQFSALLPKQGGSKPSPEQLFAGKKEVANAQ